MSQQEFGVDNGNSLETQRRMDELFRALIENASDVITIIDAGGVIRYASPSVEQALGYKPAELIGVKSVELLNPDDVPAVMKAAARAGTPAIQQVRARHKDGSWRLMEYTARHIDISSVTGTVVNSRDITERTQAENLYKTLMEKSLVAVFIVQDGKFRFINTSAIAYAEYDAGELVGRDADTIVYPEDREMVKKKGRAMLQSDHPVPYEFRMVTRQGQIRWIMQMVSPIEYKGNPAILGNAVDITERKRAEDALRQSEEKYRSILEDIQEGYFEVDFAGNFTFFNDSLRRFLDYSQEELMGMNYRQYTDKEHSKILFQAFNKVYSTGKPTEGFDWQIVRKDGTKRYAESSISLRKDSSGKPTGFRGIARDVTERKRTEEALKDSEAKYRNIFENAIEGIYQATVDGRIIMGNAALARMAGYDSPNELIESIKDVGTQLYVHPEDRKRFMEIMDAEGFVEGFEVELYKKDRSFFWIVINARPVRDERGKILYTEGLIEDITIRKQAEKQLNETLNRLRKSIDTTIGVMVTAVESRDPYTAGHQLRVAQIACTIATEMGLSPNTIEGIRMAGSIHDIGKLSIPAEILSKPTKLTDLEYSLIKEHARIGYEMLKDVESPWPLAQIVYQHHERINGSGYPGNLKGNDILIEARIMAVADVVESMASHRPYREALGIEVALEEIEKNKGILYDNAAVDACLRLFREKGYQLT